MGVMSSMYQLHGSSTSVLAVGAAGDGSGTIHVKALVEGEKSIGVMAGTCGRK